MLFTVCTRAANGRTKKNIYSMYTFNLLFNGAVAKFSWLTGHNHCKWTFNWHDKYVKNISFSTYILVFSYIESKIKHSSRSLKWFLPSLHRSIDRSAKVVYGLKVTKNFFFKDTQEYWAKRLLYHLDTHHEVMFHDKTINYHVVIWWTCHAI